MEEGHLSNEFASNRLHGYRASVSYVDAQLGRVFNTLKEKGLDEKHHSGAGWRPHDLKEDPLEMNYLALQKEYAAVLDSLHLMLKAIRGKEFELPIVK